MLLDRLGWFNEPQQLVRVTAMVLRLLGFKCSTLQMPKLQAVAGDARAKADLLAFVQRQYMLKGSWSGW